MKPRINPLHVMNISLISHQITSENNTNLPMVYYPIYKV